MEEFDCGLQLDKEKKTKEEEEGGWRETIDEAAVGKGLSGALKLLRGRGSLKETIHENGREREDFRIFSHQFHGKPPGKKKQEKRMRRHQEELKMKQMDHASSLSVERMREAQARLKSPYLHLTGNRQSSDPRSVQQKNLAPKIGDKKVKHLLNMKRKNVKDDSSSQKKQKA